jgi:signal transduction histidine kinase
MSDRFTTIRARLLLGTSLATAVILVGAGLMLYVFVRASLFAEFDMALRSSADALAALMEQNAQGVTLEPQAANLVEFARKRTPEYFAAWLDGGQRVASSPSLDDATLAHPAPAVGASITQAMILPDGLPGRQVTLSFIPAFEDAQGNISPGTQRVTLTVARHTKDLDRKLLRMIALLIGVGAAATLGAAGAMLLVVRRGLRPLDLLAGRISSIGRDDLSQRVELSDAPAELTAVVLRLNELLDRLQATVIRERRFTADVAHELRTPLAGLEAILDVCATRSRTAEEYERTLAKCQRIVRGMHAMVDSLMTLARADAGQLPVTLSTVPLAALVQECWSAFEPAAVAKGLNAVFEIDRELSLHTDAEKLRMVVNNLLDNAVSHADRDGSLRVETRRLDDPWVELRIANSGSTLTDAQARRAFDRFWRGDAARRNTGVHCGLGLSLCRELVTVLSGEITASSDSGKNFVVRVLLPRVPPGAPPAGPEDHEETDRADAAGVLPAASAGLR